MKLIHCDGQTLTVRDAGPVLLTIKKRTVGPPIKFNGFRILEDDDARVLIREFLNLDLYDYQKL